MADPQRLEDLRRRVQKDPASLAFAQLAEECRRAGHHHEAVRVCRAGLAHHPDYLSARVTLGRALLALDHLDQAGAELAGVLRIAPENLAALRGLAEVHHRRGAIDEALRHYRAALALAPLDHEIASALEALEREGPPAPPERPPAMGLSVPAAPDTASPPLASMVPTAFPRPAPDASPGRVLPPAGPPVASTGAQAGVAGGGVSGARLRALQQLERWLVAIEARRTLPPGEAW